MFRTRYNYFKYLVIPFSLTNTPTTFQSYIHTTLRDYLDKFYIVYLNNILIYSKIKKKHKEYIRKVLKRLRQIQLFVNLKKYKFFS